MTNIKFSGIVYWDPQKLLLEVVPDINEIRKWAYNKKIITEPEFQLITQETIDDLARFFTGEDELSICVSLSKNDNGELSYFEYPFIPIKTLIKKELSIKLVYWNKSNIQNPILSEIRFGFWLDDSTLEYSSATSGKLVIQKFNDLFQQLENLYPIKNTNDGIGAAQKEIEVDGDVQAKFSKIGRLFDVNLTITPHKELSLSDLKNNMEKAIKEGKFKTLEERKFMESIIKDINNGTMEKDLEEMEKAERNKRFLS